MKNTEKNYWPHAILGIILSVVIAGAYTINIAVHNPVQESTYYMKKYQSVEDNAYELEKQKDEFDKHFALSYSLSKFKLGQNSFKINIKDRGTGKAINNAKIDLLLTRPETNDFNLKLKPLKIDNGDYVFKNIEIKKLGRWKILTTTSIEKFKGYNSYDINATRQ